MPKKPSLESRVMESVRSMLNDHFRANAETYTRFEEAIKRTAARVEDIERATRRDIAAGGGYTFVANEDVKGHDVSVSFGPIQPPAEGRLLGRDNPGVIDQRAQLRERADALLEQTENRHVFKLDEPRHRVGVDVDLVERVEKALNGEYTAYEPGAEQHSHLLILSTVVNLRKRIDQQEKLLRFLVDRAGDGK